MNDTLDTMMRACLDGLTGDERRQLAPGLLARIVALCADAVGMIGDDEIPAGLQYIDASTIRPFDAIWNADTQYFLDVDDVACSELGTRVKFRDGTTAMYGCNAYVQIPPNRAAAHSWNERRRVNQRHIEFYAGTPNA